MIRPFRAVQCEVDIVNRYRQELFTGVAEVVTGGVIDVAKTSFRGNPEDGIDRTVDRQFGNVLGMTKDEGRLARLLITGVVVGPSSDLAVATPDVHDAAHRVLRVRFSEIGLEPSRGVGVEEVPEISPDHFVRTVAELLGRRTIDGEKNSFEVMNADESAAVLDELSVAALVFHELAKQIGVERDVPIGRGRICEGALELANTSV